LLCKIHFLTDEIKNAALAQNELNNNPRLAKLYRRYIDRKFTPQQGERNNQLVAMTTFIFRATSEETTAALVLFFYDLNQDIFSDSRETHENEMRSHLEATRQTWLDSLNTAERNRYADLAEVSQHHTNAFRVCRELADNDGRFFLSTAQMEERIGIDRQIASRILRQFAGLGIIQVTEKGTQNKAIEKEGGKIVMRGKATTYRWLLRNTSGSTTCSEIPTVSNEKPIENQSI
jgi:hypothetical protein